MPPTEVVSQTHANRLLYPEYVRQIRPRPRITVLKIVSWGYLGRRGLDNYAVGSD